MCDFDKIIERAIKAVGAKDQTEMLKICGFSDSSVGNWRRRDNRIPKNSLKIIAAQGETTIEWLKTGEGEMRPTENRPQYYVDMVAEIAAEYNGKTIELTAKDKILVPLFHKLTAEQQDEFIDTLIDMIDGNG